MPAKQGNQNDQQYQYGHHWTETEFESGCNSFIEACHRVNDYLGRSYGCISKDNALLQWDWASSEDIPSFLCHRKIQGKNVDNKDKKDSKLCLWLLHPPVVTSVGLFQADIICSFEDDSELHSINEYEEDMEYYDSYVDIGTYVETESNGGNNGDYVGDNDGGSDGDRKQVEWSFDVVYSPTWRVPVLYFRVRYVDAVGRNPSGARPTRCQVLQLLLSRRQYRSQYGKDFWDDEDHEDAAWNFLSEEMHPITGVPSFFLHPCHIAERVGQLCTHAVCTDSDTVSRAPPSLLILFWMSLLMPAVNHTFPPKIYQLLHQYLSSRELVEL